MTATTIAALRRELDALYAAAHADHELRGRVSRARLRVERKRELRREIARRLAAVVTR